MNSLEIENEIYIFFKDRVYIMDLLLDKKVTKPAYKENRVVIYEDFIISFNSNFTIKVEIHLLEQDILNKLETLKKFNNYLNLITSSYKIQTTYIISLNGILYEDVEILKELILEVYKYGQFKC